MNAPDQTLIDQLAAAVAARVNRIPIEIDLWSATEIAEYLKVTSRHVLERFAPHPTFPRAIRLPTCGGGTGQPRWKAVEIIEWVSKHQENAARGRAKKAA